MTTIVSVPPPEEPRRRLWTREEFTRAAEMGLFGPEERLELVEGEIIQKVTQNSPHATGIRDCEEEARLAFPSGFDVRVQLPLALSETSQPDPDIAVVVGSRRDYEEAHPTTAVLVIEVSDTTLGFDRTAKAAMYAKAGIPEYWILNLNDRQLEVHREPALVSGQDATYHYHSLTHYPETDSVAPLSASERPIRVADLLPRKKGVKIGQ